MERQGMSPTQNLLFCTDPPTTNHWSTDGHRSSHHRSEIGSQEACIHPVIHVTLTSWSWTPGAGPSWSRTWTLGCRQSWCSSQYPNWRRPHGGGAQQRVGGVGRDWPWPISVDHWPWSWGGLLDFSLGDLFHWSLHFPLLDTDIQRHFDWFT